jgi:CheY-like chemotaxis protein
MTRPEEKTVLIVDDEPDVVAYFAGILERAGFNVLTAANGEEALESVRGQRPDFISLDLVMPRKSGIRFLYELRKNKDWARIPIMIVTAHAGDELGQSDFQEIFSGKTLVGPLTYLEKPVRPEHFLHTVKKVLGLAPLEEDREPESREHLQREISTRLEDVDMDTLERLLKTLERGAL